MNFQESVRYLLSLGRELAAPTQAAAAKFNLENITILAKSLDYPQQKYPSVHIAGTNGKGSTAAFLESVLRNAGYRTGLYTSPHLERINERIRVNSEEIPDQAFADVFSRIRSVILGRGLQDEWYTAAKLARDEERLRAADVDVQIVTFQGGHEWSEEFRMAAARFLRTYFR